MALPADRCRALVRRLVTGADIIRTAPVADVVERWSDGLAPGADIIIMVLGRVCRPEQAPSNEGGAAAAAAEAAAKPSKQAGAAATPARGVLKDLGEGKENVSPVAAPRSVKARTPTGGCLPVSHARAAGGAL